MSMYASGPISPDTMLKVGVGVILTDHREHILLEKRRDNGRWGLPGGGLEPGESVREAAIRETREETGLDIVIQELIGVYSNPEAGRIVTYPDNGDIRHLVDVVVLAAPLAGRLRISEESLELRFFSPGRLPADIVPPAQAPLEDYLNGSRGIIR